MLILQGTLRAATTLGGGTNKKTGEVIPLRNVLQVETRRSRPGGDDNDHSPRTGEVPREDRLNDQSPGACLGTWWGASGLCVRGAGAAA